jgi:hypothetical protein
MAKRKRTKMIYKTLHRKLKIAHHEPFQKPGVNTRVPGRVISSCSTCVTRLVYRKHSYFKIMLVIKYAYICGISRMHLVVIYATLQ